MNERAVAEARREFVAEPDAMLRVSGVRVTDDGRSGGVVCQVEVRRGVDVVAVVTVNGSELLRIVHDVVHVLAYGGERAP